MTSESQHDKDPRPLGDDLLGFGESVNTSPPRDGDVVDLPPADGLSLSAEDDDMFFGTDASASDAASSGGQQPRVPEAERIEDLLASGDGEAGAGSQHYDEALAFLVDDDECCENPELPGREPLRRRSRRVAAGVAMMLVIGAGGGFAIVRPGWIDAPSSVAVIGRIELARPEVRIVLEAPVAEFPAISLGVGEEPIEESGSAEALPLPGGLRLRSLEDSSKARSDSMAKVLQGSIFGPLPDSRSRLLPVEGAGSGLQERPVATSIASVELGVLPAGEGLQIGPGTVLDEVVESHPRFARIFPGSRVLAELNNGNLFLGTVKALGAESLSIRLDHGEISLAFRRLKKLEKVMVSSLDELPQSPEGFVKLLNQHRLAGRLLRVDPDQVVVMDEDENRVVVPRAEIDEIGSGEAQMTQVADDSGDVWIQEQAEKRLRSLGK